MKYDMAAMIGKERVDKGMWWGRAWNLVEGCSKVSAGCDYCWGESAAHMRSKNPNAKVRAANAGLTDDQGHWNGHVRVREDLLDLPLRVKKPTVFSVWMDLFHPRVPREFIEKAFDVMGRAKQHIFCICTKRPRRIPETLYPFFMPGFYLSNVILMTTAEDQKQADIRLPELLKVNAPQYGNGGWKLGMSIEPCLGGIDLDPAICPDCGERGFTRGEDGMPYCNECGTEMCHGNWLDPLNGGIGFVTLGGESGYGARPMHPDWARGPRNQCRAAGVPFHFKQWGEWAPCPSEEWHGLGPTGRPKQLALSPKGETAGGFLCKELGKEREREGWLPIQRIGKKAAGRMLDGVIHNGFPAMGE